MTNQGTKHVKTLYHQEKKKVDSLYNMNLRLTDEVKRLQQEKLKLATQKFIPAFRELLHIRKKYRKS